MLSFAMTSGLASDFYEFKIIIMLTNGRKNFEIRDPIKNLLRHQMVQ